MKDVLIINLTRMGDLVQTTPVIAGLKDRYPGAKITLLVNVLFSEICSSIPFIDRVVVVDMNGFMERLNTGNLVSSFHYIEDILHKVNHTTYDLVINFTHSSVSAVLTSLIHAKEIRGLSIDEEGYSVKRHLWIRYFFNVIPGRDFNPFHLCDMYIKAGGAMPQKRGLHLFVSEDEEEWVKAILREQGIEEDDLLIGFQLGASAEDKKWHIKSFAELSERLTGTFGAKILLIGSGKELILGKEFESVARIKPLNLIGKTNLKELTALLKRCNLLISNDTGPLHIATAVGTTVIDISLASVHFRETGPYGEGHYVIESDIPCSPCDFQMKCNDMVCKEVINVNNVFELVKRLFTEKTITTMNDGDLWKNVQVYRSYFERDGLVEYRPLIKRPLKKEMLFRHIYRQTWLKILDREDPSYLDDIYHYFVDKLYYWYDINSTNISLFIADELNALFRLKSLVEIGLSKVSLIAREAKKPSPDIEWIKEKWKDIPMIDQEIETIGSACVPLRPLTILFKYGKESLEGKDLATLSDETSVLYNDLKIHISMIIRFIGWLGQVKDLTCSHALPCLSELINTNGLEKGEDNEST